ncbi:MAG TPA: Trk system potassium transporter TrkA [Alphaproteobacteria bacterium]|nr:Trk system potassium transporter TrkA [Alphaproteobacteria bacterium]
MKVVVCGAGQVGFSIARYLSTHDNDVTIIDQSEELINHISGTLDVRGIVGFASHPDVLAKAGLGETDMIIAVTFADEVNMVACQIAHSLFNVPLKIARVRSKSYLNPDWSDLYNPDNMPIDLIISPELEVARAIGRGLDFPGTFEVIPFGDKTIQLVGIRCKAKAPILNTPLRLLEGLFPQLDLSVLFIVRGDSGFIPTGSDQLQENDEVYLLIPQEKFIHAIEAFGFSEQRSQRLLILGGGNVGFCLAEEVETKHPDISLSLIEMDKDRATYVANQLTRTVVLRGDALDREILREANAKLTNKVVAVTSDDKVNILASLLAKRMGAEQTMALINSSSYSSLVTSLSIDSLISPKALTVSSILQYVRRGRIRTVHSIRDNFGEVIEAEAVGTSSVLGMTVEEINVPRSLIIGAIIRDDQILMPRNDTVIKVHDRVILMVTSAAVKRFEKLFSVRLEYF